MLRLIERLMGSVQPVEPAAPTASDGALAAAALFAEAATVDGSLVFAERLRIEEFLADRFGLGTTVARQLLDRALVGRADAGDWQGYTRVLKESFGEAGRIAVVEMLWEIVLADGSIDDLEASLMRRIPALLYVSDRENAAARGRAAERIAAAADPWSSAAALQPPQ